MIVDRRLGRLLTVDETAARLRCSPATVARYATTGQLLRLGNHYLDFVFGPPRSRPTLIPDLPVVLAALARGCDEPWLWALWLSGTIRKHAGWSAVDALADGTTEHVLERARNEDWSWTADDLH
jgi:hypothetical protein